MTFSKYKELEKFLTINEINEELFIHQKNFLNSKLKNWEKKQRNLLPIIFFLITNVVLLNYNTKNQYYLKFNNYKKNREKEW